MLKNPKCTIFLMLVIEFGESDIIMIDVIVMEVDLVWVGLALSDFLLRKFRENKLLLNFIFLDCSWFAKEFKVTLQSGGSMSLKEFGFDIKDMRMRWGGWVFLRKIKMFISNFFNEKKKHLAFHRVLQLYTLLNTSYRCQQDMIFLIYKILICIHVSCWTCLLIVVKYV